MYRRRYDTKAAARQSLNCIKNKKKYGENDFQYSRWNSYTMQCGTIMTLISPSDCSLQCGMWLWNSPSGSTLQCDTWLWDDMPLNSPILEFYIWFRFRPHHRSRHVILHQSPNFYPNRTTLGRKKDVMSIFISAILDFRSPIMGSLKSSGTTSYRSLIDTISLNCLVFEKITFLHFGDRQTNKQTNRWIAPTH